MATTRAIRSVTNAELYDKWAKVYDTDGNILQAIDDSLFPSLLARASFLLKDKPSITVTEFGCGTGRNTVKLHDVSETGPGSKGVEAKEISQIFAFDLSLGMLSLAKKRWEEVASHGPPIQFLEFNALEPSQAVTEILTGKADLIISTLVLEHLPLDLFFKTTRSFVKRTGGYLILTNMHADMGRRSQAGFLDEETGQKLQGNSFVYEIEEVVEEGKKWGFVVEGEVAERAVGDTDVGEEGKSALLGKRGKKWVDCKVWFGCVMRYEG